MKDRCPSEGEAESKDESRAAQRPGECPCHSGAESKDESRADERQMPERMVLFHENECKRSLNGKTDLLLLFPSFAALAR